MCVFLHKSMYVHTPLSFWEQKLEEVEIILNKSEPY